MSLRCATLAENYPKFQFYNGQIWLRNLWQEEVLFFYISKYRHVFGSFSPIFIIIIDIRRDKVTYRIRYRGGDTQNLDYIRLAKCYFFRPV